MKTLSKLFVLSVFLCGQHLSTAQVPEIISYQGRVTVNGTNFDGTGQFKFALVDRGRIIFRPPLPPTVSYHTYWSHDGSSSGGSAPTSSVPVTVSQGMYSVLLGDTKTEGMTQPIPPSVFTNAQVYLRVWFDDGTHGLQQLTPDQRFTATPFALQAARVDAGAITSEMLASGAVTAAAIADNAITGDKIQSGSIRLSQVDDAGAASYQAFVNAAQTVGAESGLPFSELAPVKGAEGASSALGLTINGAKFGTVVGFSGSESISKPYFYAVQVLQDKEVIDPDTQIGLPATLTFTRNGRTTRFSGLVTAFARSSANGSRLLYTVRLESALAYLELNFDYRVNQNMTAPEVASALYQSITTNSLTQRLSGSYVPRDNLVQYAETSLNFFSRLLEHEGIFYFFDHTSTPAQLVLADSSSAYSVAANSPFVYLGNSATNIPSTGEYIRTFQNASHQSTLRSSVSGYNFTMPIVSQLKNAVGTQGAGEQYEFNTEPDTAPARNSTLARIRQDRQAVERATMSGSSTAPDLRAGYTFELQDESGAGLASSYLVTSVEHAGFVRVTNGVSRLYYGNRFQAVPASLNYRPPLASPRPKAQACTAIVTGPAGKEVYVDKFGRIKVQFHWDRYGSKNEKSSAWLRVASQWAGNSFGTVFIPRVGQEVLVEFLHGDPDQPVVIGSLYNTEMMPPYDVVNSPTTSGIRTRSSEGGGLSNFNEIKFDDKKGAETLDISGEKDLNLRAKNNLTMAAQGDMSVSAGLLNLSSPGGVSIGLGGSTASTALKVNGTVQATSFQGDGSALTGSVNDARLSANVALRNANQTFSGQNSFTGPVNLSGSVQAYNHLTMNQNDLFLKDDDKHGLGYYGGSKTFAGIGPDGPILYGYSGGALGTLTFDNANIALSWNQAGHVAIGGTDAPASTLDVF
ncbi:MAG TPA: type VI secretion system tip protein TssI/VgrG, partial [Clostridia bacterium]|nr:type VI secretion system tip protein TssI/VgrG [Clostridia bacterium]